MEDGTVTKIKKKSEKKLRRIIMIYSWLTKILYIYSLVKARFTQVLAFFFIFCQQKRNLHENKSHIKEDGRLVFHEMKFLKGMKYSQ